MKLFATIATFLGSLIALTATGACACIWIDEVQLPDSLIR